jgi:hypothetical protein
MKRIASVNLIIPVFLIALALSCQDDEPRFPLNGTEWKLTGFVDVATGEIKEPEPRDCAECYTLAFLSDEYVRGLSVNLSVTIKNIYDFTDPCINCMDMIIDEVGDGNYYQAVFRAYFTSFEYEPGVLKLFYKNNLQGHTGEMCYLLYKQI